MMPRIAVLQIGVTDMPKAIDFYCGLLGFEIDSKDDAPHYVTLKNGDGPTLLLAKVEAPARTDYPREAQVLLNLATEDLARDIAQMKAAGATMLHDTPQPCPVGVYAALKDPSGNVLELLQLG